MDQTKIGSIVAEVRQRVLIPVRIDMRPRNGLETAHPGRHGCRREQARFATFGPLKG